MYVMYVCMYAYTYWSSVFRSCSLRLTWLTCIQECAANERQLWWINWEREREYDKYISIINYQLYINWEKFDANDLLNPLWNTILKYSGRFSDQPWNEKYAIEACHTKDITFQINRFILSFLNPDCYYGALRSFSWSILELVEPIARSLHEDGTPLSTRLQGVVHGPCQRLDWAVHRAVGPDYNVSLPAIVQQEAEGDASTDGDLRVSAQGHENSLARHQVHCGAGFQRPQHVPGDHFSTPCHSCLLTLRLVRGFIHHN